MAVGVTEFCRPILLASPVSCAVVDRDDALPIMRNVAAASAVDACDARKLIPCANCADRESDFSPVIFAVARGGFAC